MNISEIISNCIHNVLYETTVDKNGQMDMFDDMQWGDGRDKAFEDDNIDTNIELTLEWVQQHYDKFNQEYFGGVLDPFGSIVFQFSSGKNTWGRGGVTKHFFNPDGTLGYEQTFLSLNNSMSYREEDAENTLIHEMVHIYEHTRKPEYIAEVLRNRQYSKDYPKDGHGTIFYAMAKKLSKSGFNVQRFVSAEEDENARLSKQGVDEFKRKHQNGVPIIAEFDKDGRVFLAKALTRRTINAWRDHLRDILKRLKKIGKSPMYVNLYYGQNVALIENVIPKTQVGNWGFVANNFNDIVGKWGLVFGEVLLNIEECKITKEESEEFEKERERENTEWLEMADMVKSGREEISELMLDNMYGSFRSNSIPFQSVMFNEMKIYFGFPERKFSNTLNKTSMTICSPSTKIAKIINNGRADRQEKGEAYQIAKKCIIDLINDALELFYKHYEKLKKQTNR